MSRVSSSGSNAPLGSVLAGALLLAYLGCGGEEPTQAGPEKRGAPPPPAASSAAMATPQCTRQAASDEVAKVFLPGKLEGFCLDPSEPDKSFGQGTKEPLEKIADLFDGEAKNYEDYGVTRVVHARYVAEAGGGVSIDVHASKFTSDTAAYAMFTKRVVSDGDPANDATPKATPGGGAATLGVGNAYLWRGPWLLEIVYNDDTATPVKLEQDSRRVLGPLVKAIGELVPGEVKPPAEVALLPSDDRVPMGVRYYLAGAVPGTGADPDVPAKGSLAGAVGYYRSGDKRFRVTLVAPTDEAAAKSAFAALTKAAGAKAAAGVGDEAVAFGWKEGALEGSVLVARKGARVVALWDELRVLRGGMPEAERAKLLLSAEEKQKKLTTLLEKL